MIALVLILMVGNAYFFQSHFDSCESQNIKHKSCKMYYKNKNGIKFLDDEFILDDQKLDE